MPRCTSFVLNQAPRAGALLAAAGLCTSLFAQAPDPSAQPASPAAPTWYVPSDSGDASGRDFAGIRLPAAIKVGDITVHASRCWVWSEGGTSAGRIIGPDGLPVGTQRLMLQGDVVVELGGYKFTSAQAVIWTQNLGATAVGFGQPAVDSDRQIRQIGIFFDRVSDPGSEAGFAQAADRLLVTAVLDGTLALQSDALVPGRPAGEAQTPFLGESEQRWQRYLRELTGKPVHGEVKPTLAPGAVSDNINPMLARPYEPNSPITRQNQGKPTKPPEVPIEDRVEPLFAKDGIVTFAVGTRAPDSAVAPEVGEPITIGGAVNANYARIVRGQDDNTAILAGGVALQYVDLRKTRNLLITAERAVIFMPPGPISDIAKLSSEQIRGIYLEGDVVATDGQYTLRGPRVFYDFQQNKAVVADAVFSTIDAKLGIPIYVRAETLRQEAANQVRAEHARLSTSSFFEPVFSIGVQNITVTEAPAHAEGGRKVTFVDAKSITPRLGGVPFFWLPGFKGEIDNIPLQDIRTDGSSESGGALKTTWSIPGLLGMAAPDGLNARVLIDYYFDRGFAAGTRTDWATPNLTGQLFAYMLTNDNGRDVLSNGTRLEQDQQFRGIFLAENRWDINPSWTLFGELSKISDETFVDGFFKELGSEGREVRSDLYLRYLGSNSYFSAMVKGTFDDFTPNQYLLESQGYTVNKLPEFKYARLADDLLPGVQPGLLTWTHEYSVSRVAFKFTEPTIGEFGFTNPFVTNAEFGINPNQSFGDRQRALGFNEDPVGRADTRQELAAVLDWGPIRINPFVVGRFTGYDEKINEFAALAPDGDDQYRLWYAAGTRFSTEIERIDDSVESSFFDLHRIRHIITPSATLWTASSTIRQESLPVYDDTVEALNTGSAVRAGMTNVWQTQRGGPGRWHSVDVFKLTTDVTYASSDHNTTSPFGRFFDDRPEYSFLGNFFSGEAAWQLSDALGLTFSSIYDFDANQPARTTAGGIIQHSPEFSTYGQVRYLNPLNATYVDAGLNYQLTRVYSISTGMTYDADLNEIQNINAVLRRRFQDASLGVRVSFNSITDETSIGIIFEPAVVATQRQGQLTDRLRDIGR